MAGINPNKIYAPSPDQSMTVGAIAVAPVGTSAPTDARTALTSPWNTSGYVSEDGLSMSLSRSTTVIKDWSKATVRTILTEFLGTLSFNFLQVDKFSADRMLGSANVAVTSADSTHGEQTKLSIGASLPPVESWCFSMKDGDKRVRVYVPKGQMTDISQVDFKPDAGNIWGGTLTTYDDGTGHNIYVIYDDGEVISGSSLGSITVASAAGTASGDTKLTVSGYTPGSGESYVYKTHATNAPELSYHDVPDYTWTAWDGTSDITATNGHKIAVVSVDAEGRAVAAGSATVVSA